MVYNRSHMNADIKCICYTTYTLYIQVTLADLMRCISCRPPLRAAAVDVSIQRLRDTTSQQPHGEASMGSQEECCRGEEPRVISTIIARSVHIHSYIHTCIHISVTFRVCLLFYLYVCMVWSGYYF